MELISILRRSLASRRSEMLIFSAILTAVGAILLALGQQPWLRTWLNRLPNGWQAIFGLPAGWTALAGFGWIFPAVLGWYAILQGAALIAGEEERGALALLLVGSVRPAELVWMRWLVLLLLTFLPTAGLGVVLLAGGLAGWGSYVLGQLPGTLLALWLFSVLCGSVALLAGCLSGRVRAGWLVGGVTLGLGAALDRLGEVIPTARFFQYITPYGWYGGPRLDGGLWLPGILLLVTGALACALAAAIGFSQRDLPV